MFLGICSQLGERDELPVQPIRMTPLTGAMLNVLPRVGDPGGAVFFVVKATSGPAVVPAALVATSLHVVERVRAPAR